MSLSFWHTGYLIQKLAVLAVVWIIVQRHRRTAPIACRCLKWSIGMSLMAMLVGIASTSLLRGPYTFLGQSASEFVEVLVTDLSAWAYLLVTGAAATFGGITHLLVAYAALAQPDRQRRECEPAA
jgi:hypothetical protein